MAEHPTHALPSYLNAHELGPWGIYLEQVERVTPYLGKLARWVETLKRPKRSLIVDIPIELDNGTIAHFEGKSEEHTSELQSLMRISYAVFCLNKTKNTN